MLLIRPAAVSDVPLLLRFSREFAEYERQPDAVNLGLKFLLDTPHDWTGTHGAWNGGNSDQWVLHKGTTSMVHLTRDDIPFHYALADAFTVCDAYHCSLLGPTDPNRYHMWTGWPGNDGKRRNRQRPPFNVIEHKSGWIS
jgi:phospholipase C